MSGRIGWHDLTVGNADEVRDFYRDVVGWTHEPLDMGGYADYVMKDSEGNGVAGVCHARGANAAIPPQWLIYFMVADIDASVAAVTARGGELVTPVRKAGNGRFCVIRDPAGAVAALYQEGAAS